MDAGPPEGARVAPAGTGEAPGGSVIVGDDFALLPQPATPSASRQVSVSKSFFKSAPFWATGAVIWIRL